jgi:predicted transcriptional regulator
LAVAVILNDAFLEMLISQKRFGELLGGIPQQTVSQYLRGERALDVDLFVNMCRATLIDPVEVLSAALVATE